MPCSSTRCPGRPPYVLFPLTVGLPLMGSHPPRRVGHTLRKDPDQGIVPPPALLQLAMHHLHTAARDRATPCTLCTAELHCTLPEWSAHLRCGTALHAHRCARQCTTSEPLHQTTHRPSSGTAAVPLRGNAPPSPRAAAQYNARAVPGPFVRRSTGAQSHSMSTGRSCAAHATRPCAQRHLGPRMAEEGSAPTQRRSAELKDERMGQECAQHHIDVH